MVLLGTTLFAVVLWHSKMQAPIGFQTLVIWGPIPWVAALKVGVLDVWSKPLTLQREAGSWRFLPYCMALVWGCGVWREHISLSNPFQCGYFLSHPICKSCSSSFRISLRGHFSMCICPFGAFMGGGKFRSLLCCHFGWVSHLYSFFNLNRHDAKFQFCHVI